MKILFLGSPKTAIPILEKISKSKHDLVAVITQSAKPKGREKKLSKTDIAIYCNEKSIKTYESDDINQLFINEIKDLEFDLAIVVAYGQIIPSHILKKSKFGWINLHYSLLPKFRGAAPVQWAILKQVLETGITWFQIDEGLDTGPILKQKSIEIKDFDYSQLINKLNDLAIEDFEEFLNQIENGTIDKIVQKGDPSFAPKINEYDLKVDWHQNLENVKSKIKAGNEHLYAWTNFQGQKIKILNSLGSGEDYLDPGCIQKKSKAVNVGTSSKALILGDVIPQGKKKMTASDWLNGIQNKENLKFE
jgi:methionyl-tRNA formyltransferase